MATDTEDLVLTISADVRQMQRALARLTGDTDKATRAIQTQFDAAGNKAATAFDRVPANANRAFSGAEQGARRMGSAMQASSVQTGNLTAQLQDIAVQLQSGASPLTIAAQQGTQISAALGGQGAAGAIRSLGAAFVGLVNPVSLVSVGLIAAVGYAVQYFTAVDEGSEEAAKALEKQEQLIGRLADRWGEAIPELRAYADEIARLKDLADLSQGVAVVIQREFEEAAKSLEAFFAAADEAVNDLETGGASVSQALYGPVKALQEAQADLIAEQKRGGDVSDEYARIQKAIAELTQSQSIPATGALREAVERLAQAYGTAAAAAQKAADAEANRRAGLAVQEGNPLGTLSPLESGGGRFLNPAEAQSFRANEAAIAAAAESAAGRMVAQLESFRPNAYWDVNAYRTGFGSDTVTRADGSIEKVTKDTTVTLVEATRDLGRRILEFQNGIRQSIGSDRFASFTQEQQAALTSIAYNYGSLPDRIVNAIVSGGDVGAAIRGLGGDNGGINRGRRNSEADAFNSTAAAMNTRAAEEQRREAERAAKQRSSLLRDPDPLAAYRPDPWAGLRGVTGPIQSTEELLAANKRLQESYNGIADAGLNAFKGIVDAMRDGKITADEFLQIAINLIEQLAQVPAIPQAGAQGGGLGGGLLGGLGSLLAGIFHEGGVVGQGGRKRAVNPLVFAGAPRMHRGGLAGDEVPAILQRGEIVLPRGASAAQKGVHVTVGLASDGALNIMPEVRSVSETTLRRGAPQIIGQSRKAARADFGRNMADAQLREM